MSSPPPAAPTSSGRDSAGIQPPVAGADPAYVTGAAARDGSAASVGTTVGWPTDSGVGNTAATAAPVSSASPAAKNWPAIRLATPVIIRCPTPATGPPTTASAEFVTRVPPSTASSEIGTVARTCPGAPAPEACMTYDDGRCWSVRCTSPA